MTKTEHHYGQTYEEVSRIRHPEPTTHSWGKLTVCSDRPEFLFYRLDIQAGQSLPYQAFRSQYVAYLVESGVIDIRMDSSVTTLEQGQVFYAEAGVPHALSAQRDAIVYAFSQHRALAEATLGKAAGNPSQTLRGAATTDFRDKYWGTIETILSQDVAGKRILLRAGTQSSLEYHVRKTEAYYIHSGKVRVGLRVGRAENRSVVLGPGDVFEVNPGTMHMRIGIEDSVIIEASTRDDDSDSHLVEDGKTYKHIEKQNP